MHGLINRSIQSFLRDTYGAALWLRVARGAGLDFDSFEPMLRYDDALTGAVLASATRILNRPLEGVLEDLGTYLVSHPNLEPLRRLLRFGGVTYLDFLQSLDDLPGRSRLAVPDLDLPQLELIEEGGDQFTLVCRGGPRGFGLVMLGVLRAMADDYGALVLLDDSGVATTPAKMATDPPDRPATGEEERIAINLLDPAHALGRRFELAASGGEA
ncbi:heme NO-binding domain-containing protein [Acidimangrovimonas sediminis]|uniref:heme NO-binding domain-containing protein n=1 Tax=Acidimangrovimonas sediminis TaxID=2056283 RepID=UPI000C8089AF|nr:heme NO-binding domain-containing protein [Acidimangrovimonas sediminis]